MKILFATFMIIHGLFHLVGASKVLDIALSIKMPGRSQQLIWIAACLIFILAASLLLLNKHWWCIAGAAGVLLSQYLIIRQWQDAKYGTLINLIILLILAVSAATWHFKGRYFQARNLELSASKLPEPSVLKEQDLEGLPQAVSRYIRYSGAVGKPKIVNFRIEFGGRIRSGAESKWMPFTSEQYNFIKSCKRIFFMKANMKGLPVAGYHSYYNGMAFMDIRLFSIWPVQYQDGEEMNRAETVTFFNDLCCFAPGALIDKRITWLSGDDRQVKAVFTNHNISVSALLKFNEAGQLTNFISGDRYAWKSPGTMMNLPWSTPLSDYRDIKGLRLAHNARTMYEYPAGPFCYGAFTLRRIDYNLNSNNRL